MDSYNTIHLGLCKLPRRRTTTVQLLSLSKAPSQRSSLSLSLALCQVPIITRDVYTIIDNMLRSTFIYDTIRRKGRHIEPANTGFASFPGCSRRLGTRLAHSMACVNSILFSCFGDMADSTSTVSDQSADGSLLENEFCTPGVSNIEGCLQYLHQVGANLMNTRE